MPFWIRPLASTIAVVVPSPATSLVCIETSRTTCAPMFSKRSKSSISLAMVTPVARHDRRADRSVDHRVHAARTEGGFNRRSELADAARKCPPRFHIVDDLLCHDGHSLPVSAWRFPPLGVRHVGVRHAS
jgi:hypothetical protein